MKQVKILKRPSSSSSSASPSGIKPLVSTPQTPQDRVSAEITKLLHDALTRERARLEQLQKTRQEALFRSIASMLSSRLSTVIHTAATRETDALVTAFAKLNTSAAPESIAPSTQTAASARDAFAAAFEKTALPAFEASVREMLTTMATMVEKVAEERVVAPAAEVATAMARAADEIRSVKAVTVDLIATAATRPQGDSDPDAEDMRIVQNALDAGDVRSALLHATGKSATVCARAVNGALDSDVSAQDVLGDLDDLMPPRRQLVLLAAILASDLGDRTEQRISWLYEVVTSMDDAPEFDLSVAAVVEDSKWLLESVIEKLRQFSKGGAMAARDVKHVKLLIRVLTAHVKAM